MMAYIRQVDPSYQKGFGFLYAANVLGALSGTLITAFVLVEILGFRLTLQLGGALNFLIAAASLAMGLKRVPCAGDPKVSESFLKERVCKDTTFAKVVLFGTGFVSLGMEVVWTRALTPVMGTQVYSFELLLFVYLLATWLGSLTQSSLGVRARRSVFRRPKRWPFWPWLRPAGCNQMTQGSTRRLSCPRQFLFHARLFPYLASIFPFCFLLGYFTPRLIDDYASGNPRVAGTLYAFNSAGCILGRYLPATCFCRGPEYNCPLVLAVPCLVCRFPLPRAESSVRLAAGGASSALMVICALVSQSYECPWSRADGGSPGSYCDHRLVWPRQAQTNAGQWGSHYGFRPDNKVHGPPTPCIPSRTAEDGPCDLFRHGNNVPIFTVLGCADYCGRASTKCKERIFFLLR
jgi:hypothetical protein